MRDKVRRKLRWQVSGFFFISGLFTASWNSRIPDIQQKLQLTDGAWGTVLVSLPAGMVTGLIISSLLIARFGTARVTTVSAVVACILLALLGRADERVPLMIALFFMGFNRAIMNISVNTGAVEVQRFYQKPVVASFHGIWSLACFGAAAIGTAFIIYGFNPATHFLTVAIVAAIAVLFLRFRRSPFHKTEGRRFVFRPDGFLLLLGCIAFFSMAAENTMFDWSITYFDKIVHSSRDGRTAGYTAFILAMSAGRLTGDRLIHKLGTIPVLIGNGLVMAAGFFLVAISNQPVIAIAGCLLIGFGDATVVPVAYSIAGKRSSTVMAYAIASVTTIGYIGFFLNPLLVGGLSEAFGLRWGFALMIAFSLAISVLGWKIGKRMKGNLHR